MMKPIQKSLQLVSYNLDAGRFEINEKALLFLQNLGKPFAITTITGSICSGKSYLLNEIIGQEGFIVGSKSMPQTKGIWISKTPLLSLDQEYYHVFLDGEGLSSIDKDSDYDIKLLLLQLMISSTLVFNSFGAIQQSSLQTIRGSIGLKKYCYGQWNRISHANLIWIARDFNLSLEDRYGNSISENNYLQNALKDIQGDGKSDTKHALKQGFPNRNCYCLVRPTINQSILRHLSNHHKKIKPQFLSKIAEIRKGIICESRPKVLNNSMLSPSQFVSMIKSLIKSINSIGAVSASTWSSIAQQNNQKLFQNCISRFTDKLSTLQLPLSSTTISRVVNQFFVQTQREYTLNIYGDQSLSYELSSHNHIGQLKSIMQKQMNDILETNTQLLKKQSVVQFEQLWSEYKIQQSISSPENLKSNLLSLSSKLSYTEQWTKFSQRLINLIVSLLQKVRHGVQNSNELQFKGLKNDYDLLKNIHTNTLGNIVLLQNRIKGLDQNVESVQSQKNRIKNKITQVTNNTRSMKQEYEFMKQQLKKTTVQFSQLQYRTKQLQKELNEKQKQNEHQIKIFLQQKTVYEQQQKFYERQIFELKSNIEIVKNNCERSSQGLLQNNQILRRLQNMRNKDKDLLEIKGKENNEGEYRKEKQLKVQIVAMEEKTKRLESNVRQLSERVKKEQQNNINLRTQLASQLSLNKQLELSKRSYQEMIGSLQNNLAVIEAAQEREKKLYEESVLRLIENIEKREQQYHRKEKKSQFRQRLSRHQY